MRCDAISHISGLATLQLPDSIMPGEEGNIALAWPALCQWNGGRVRNYDLFAKGEGFLTKLEWLRPRRARRLTITFASDAYIPRHRRFKRRACCADHGPAYFSGLNRLQARDCLLSVISPLLLVFHILSASPTSGRCDSRSHG